MTTEEKATPKSKSIRKDDNDTNSQSQNLLDGYIYQHLLKRKLNSTARLFRMENRDALLQEFNNDDQPTSFLQMWWLTFWGTFSSRNNPNNLNQPLTNSLSNQLAPTQDLIAKFPSDATEFIRAKVKKYFDDGRISRDFLKLLGEEDNSFKTLLKHSTPNLEEFQKLNDDDDDNQDSLYFNQEEMLKLLDEEPYEEAIKLYNSERGKNLLAAIDEEKD